MYSCSIINYKGRHEKGIFEIILKFSLKILSKKFDYTILILIGIFFMSVLSERQKY